MFKTFELRASDLFQISKVGFRILICGWIVASAIDSHAAIIFLKGSDKPLHVRTIRESETTIVVGVREANGTFTERILERRNIDQFIPTVSPARLAELDPAKPALYRDYAEELAEKKADPDARDAAIRLYLIAAHLDPKGLGRSALLGMVSLARSVDEERRFRAMAYVLDPKHDRRVLKMSASTANAGGGAVEGREDLLSALQTLRQGNRTIARRFAERPSVIAAFNHYTGSFSRDDFLAACASPEALDDATLARIIRYELEITGGRTSLPAADESDGAKWSSTLSAGDTSPEPALTLQTLTEFDPEKSVYRDGNWVMPSM